MSEPIQQPAKPIHKNPLTLRDALAQLRKSRKRRRAKTRNAGSLPDYGLTRDGRWKSKKITKIKDKRDAGGSKLIGSYSRKSSGQKRGW